VSGIVELDRLLKSMSPEIQSGEHVFGTLAGFDSDYAQQEPLATFMESEGLTLILPVDAAQQTRLQFESRFRQITLTVHSSLAAVGLTAVVATKLASLGTSANVVAAYYQDHIFSRSDAAGLEKVRCGIAGGNC